MLKREIKKKAMHEIAKPSVKNVNWSESESESEGENGRKRHSLEIGNVNGSDVKQTSSVIGSVNRKGLLPVKKKGRSELLSACLWKRQILKVGGINIKTAAMHEGVHVSAKRRMTTWTVVGSEKKRKRIRRLPRRGQRKM